LYEQAEAEAPGYRPGNLDGRTGSGRFVGRAFAIHSDAGFLAMMVRLYPHVIEKRNAK